MGGEQAPSWADGYEEDQILLPNPEIHSLLQVGFLLSNKLAVRDDVVGLHDRCLQICNNRPEYGIQFLQILHQPSKEFGPLTAISEVTISADSDTAGFCSLRIMPA